jgi:hypothetical protein
MIVATGIGLFCLGFGVGVLALYIAAVHIAGRK